MTEQLEDTLVKLNLKETNTIRDLFYRELIIFENKCNIAYNILSVHDLPFKNDLPFIVTTITAKIYAIKKDIEGDNIELSIKACIKGIEILSAFEINELKAYTTLNVIEEKKVCH